MPLRPQPCCPGCTFRIHGPFGFLLLNFIPHSSPFPSFLGWYSRVPQRPWKCNMRTYPRPALASQSPRTAPLGCWLRSASPWSSDTHQTLRETETGHLRVPLTLRRNRDFTGTGCSGGSRRPSLELTQAEMLLAAISQDVNELGLVCSPFQFPCLIQVLKGKRWD